MRHQTISHCGHLIDLCKPSDGFAHWPQLVHMVRAWACSTGWSSEMWVFRRPLLEDSKVHTPTKHQNLAQFLHVLYKFHGYLILSARHSHLANRSRWLPASVCGWVAAGCRVACTKFVNAWSMGNVGGCTTPPIITGIGLAVWLAQVAPWFTPSVPPGGKLFDSPIIDVWNEIN